MQWDELAAARRASAALGWNAALTLSPPETDTARVILLTVKDRTGTPVEGLTGIVRAGRPHRADALEERSFAATEVPGAYRLVLPLDGFGLWDFEVEARRGDDLFLTTIRKEIRSAR